MNDVEYWKNRALIAEGTLAKLLDSNPIDPYLVAERIVHDAVQRALFRADYYEAHINICKGMLDQMANSGKLDLNVVNKVSIDMTQTLRRFENE